MPAPLDLERLYDAHSQALFAFLMNLVRDEADTRDILQEVFVKLARQPSVLEGIRDERAFLIRLSHNQAIDLMRRRGTRDRNHDKLAGESAALFAEIGDPDEQGFREALGLALGELPLEQRVVVHLKLWEGLTFDAIADALEIPLNTAASRYRYGLDKLRDRLRPLYDEIPMKDFEQHLQNQRPRQIPGAWRNEILSQARDAVVPETSGLQHPESGIRHRVSVIKYLSSLISRLSSTLLWPHPKAWAGLAAVWLVIGWLNWSTMQPEASMLTVRRPDASSISPGQLASLTEQRRLQRELLGLVPVNASEPMDRPKPLPVLKPQSAIPQPCGFA